MKRSSDPLRFESEGVVSYGGVSDRSDHVGFRRTQPDAPLEYVWRPLGVGLELETTADDEKIVLGLKPSSLP